MDLKTEEFKNIPYDELLTSRGDHDYLGVGGFSWVYRCHHVTLGEVAVKILKSNHSKKILEKKMQKIKKEIKLQEIAKSDHIVKVLGIMQYSSNIGIVLEYMPMGTLESAICNAEENKVPWSFKARALHETSVAIDYLHNLKAPKRITHNDLKPLNILLTNELHVKLSDFGGATLSHYTNLQYSSSMSSLSRAKNESEHTISYAAPEFLRNINIDRTWSMDVHSFSLVIYFLVFQYHPFDGNREEVISHAIKDYQTPSLTAEKRIDCSDELEKRVFGGFKTILQDIWKNIKEPEKRPKIHVVMQHLNKLRNMFSEDVTNRDIENLKQILIKYREDDEDEISQQQGNEQITIADKIKMINYGVATGSSSRSVQSPQNNQNRLPTQSPTDISSNSTQRSQPSGARKEATSSLSTNISDLQQPSSAAVQSIVDSENDSLPILDLFNPFLNSGDNAKIVCNTNSASFLKNHFNLDITHLKGKVGKITDTTWEGCYQVLISDQSYALQGEYLEKVCSKTELLVGDVVKITLPEDLVIELQINHGNWNSDMVKYRGEKGIVFRFIPNSCDVLIVYQDGSYFRFNPDVLEKVVTPENIKHLKHKSTANPQLSIGDYVTHDIEDEMVKILQKHYGGWNEDMRHLQGRVGKLIYIDFRDRAYIAYSSKLCFIFNPVIFTSVTFQKAVDLKSEYASKNIQNAKKYVMTLSNESGFECGDAIKVCLPIDAFIQLQGEEGGWCYQMMDVYGQRGVVHGFDTKNNLQVKFDNSSNWSLNPVCVVSYATNVKDEYKPRFRVGEKVKIFMDELSGVTENQILQAIRQLNISKEKENVLTQPGIVAGMNECLEYIVEYQSGRSMLKYAVDEKRIVKL